MSSKHHYYVGPYVETRSPMGPEAVAMTSCTNEGCEVNRDHMPRDKGFCNRCGSAVGMVKYQRHAEMVDAEEVRREITDRMADWQTDEPGVRLWTPNVGGRQAPRNFEPEPRGENGATPLTPADVKAETLWLPAGFAWELEAIEHAYGPQNVRVRWGLVWMWM